MAPPADPFEITDDPAPTDPQPASQHSANQPAGRRAVLPTAHLEGLNDEQRKAVVHDAGPLLVLAGIYAVAAIAWLAVGVLLALNLGLYMVFYQLGWLIAARSLATG